MLSIQEREGRLVFTFSGRLDTAECLQFDERVASAAEAASQPVVFDLGGVDYVASLFLRICVRTAKGVGFERFTLENVNPSIRKVLKIAGLDGPLSLE